MATKLSATRDAGPELPHPLDYEPLNAARRQLTLWSSILIVWFAIGVDPTKLGPVGALTRAEWIPYLVAVIVVYQLYRWLLYWNRTAAEHRARWTVRIDALIPLELTRLGLTLLFEFRLGIMYGSDTLLGVLLTEDFWYWIPVTFLGPSLIGIAFGLSRPTKAVVSSFLVLNFGIVAWIAYEAPHFIGTTIVVFLPVTLWWFVLRQLGLDSRAPETSSLGDSNPPG